MSRLVEITCAMELADVTSGQGSAVQAAAGKGEKNRRWKIRAYSGGIAEIPGWGRVVFDLDTMDLSAECPHLRDHDQAKVLGFVAKKTVTPGKELDLEGEIIDGLNEHTDEVLKAHARGFKWQASVGLQRGNGTLEYVAYDESRTVNGRVLAGPYVLFRNARLREISTLAVGGDSQTGVEFEASAMSTTAAAPSTAAASGLPAPAGATPAPTTAPAPAAVPPVQATGREDLGALLTEFPGQEALVASAYAKGDAPAAIRAAASKAVRDQVAAKDKKIAELEARLAQPGVGFNAAAREVGNPSVTAQAGAGVAVDEADPIQAEAARAWNSKPELRAECGRFEWFLADCRRAGRVEA